MTVAEGQIFRLSDNLCKFIGEWSLWENVRFCSKKSALTLIKWNVISGAPENCFHFQSIGSLVLSLSLYFLWSVLSALNFEYLSSFPSTFPCNRRSVLTAPWLSDKNRFILLSFWTSSKIWRKMWTYVTYRVPCFLWRWNTVHNGNHSGYNSQLHYAYETPRQWAVLP